MSEALTLRSIEETLTILLDVEPGELAPEQHEAYIVDLLNAIQQSAEKREAVAHRLFYLGERAAIKRAAAQAHLDAAAKLNGAAKSIEGDAERLKYYVLQVMCEMPKPKKGVRTLEGISATFKAKAVADSVEVFDEAALPLELLQVEVTVSAHDYNIATEEYAKRPNLAFKAFLCGATIPRAVPKAEIKAALEKRVPCPTCQQTPMEAAELWQLGVACPRCHGEETVPANVPGARLVTNKLRLEVS